MADCSTGPETALPLKKDKICLVCGDKALGYNFSAVSCESCKAFFRRNAHKVIRGRCDGSCDVTVESRSFCKRCRLQKCFKVGMKKDMILNAQQKGVRKQKIILNRLRKKGQTETGQVSNLIPFHDEESLDNPQTIPSTSSGTEGVPDTVEIGEVDGLNLLPLPSKCPDPIGKLDDDNLILMSELQQAHEDALKVLVKTSQKPTPASAAEFFNLAEGSVRRIVKLAKGINAFKNQTKDDQVALLKGAVTEIMMMRSAMYFDCGKKSWDVNAIPESAKKARQSVQESCSASSSGIPEGAVAGASQDPAAVPRMSQLLKGASLEQFGKDTKIMFIEYVKFVKSLLHVIHGDLTIIQLLTAMTLFSPDRPGIAHRDCVQQVQELYAELLKQYLRLNYPEESGLFPRVVMKLTDIRDISETHSKMLTKMEVGQVEPLLAEIFDLGL